MSRTEKQIQDNPRDPSTPLRSAQDDFVLAIDASRSIDSIQKTGVEFVSDAILSEFKTQLTKHKNIIYFFYTPKKINWSPEKNQKVLNWPFRFLWTQIRLSWEMFINKPDIFFSPVHILPCFTPKKTFKIIHDIAFKKNNKIYNLKNKILLNLDLNRAIKRCKKIFVPSNSVKQDLLKYTNISENKIIIIPHGYRARNKKPRKASQRGRQETKNKKKQILYIGRIEAKKNIINLIKAFNIFNQKYSSYDLILAGKVDKDYVNKNIDLFNTSNIKLLGYISDKKKFRLLRESRCLAFLPFEEGFGIPILEAFDFNLPVVCSDIKVLRETGGEACIFVDAKNINQIAENLEKIISDKNLRNNLIEKGKQQLEKFSWQKAGKKYLEEILK